MMPLKAYEFSSQYQMARLALYLPSPENSDVYIPGAFKEFKQADAFLVFVGDCLGQPSVITAWHLPWRSSFDSPQQMCEICMVVLFYNNNNKM